jgi:hypothetical protein
LSSTPLLPFTPAGYEALLHALKERGYRAVTFEDVNPASRHVILRHDIDLDPARAVPVAEVEAAAGMASIYHVLITTRFYNPVSAESRAIWRRLIALGHRIGLHFDAAAYSADPTGLERAAADECRLLELALDAPVTAISFHRPSDALKGREAPIAGRLHTYQPRFFSDIGYCSDSEGRWRFGSPLEHEAILQGRALQLLTHPIWWTGERDDPPLVRLETFQRHRSDGLRSEMARNLRPFADAFGPDGKKAPRL